MPATIDVLCQLAVGLEYIHKMGFIHRDISPQNILIWVNPENTKKVLMKWTDFGLSRQVNATGSFYTSRHKGKEYWLAPEILELSDNNSSSSKSARQKGNYSSDVYAEGLIFGHILLNGRKYHIFGKPTEIKYFITINNQVNIKGNYDLKVGILI
jgi:serine/threonine-protein kinase/endoribonuclease IRE1